MRKFYNIIIISYILSLYCCIQLSLSQRIHVSWFIRFICASFYIIVGVQVLSSKLTVFLPCGAVCIITVASRVPPGDNDELL